MDEDRFPNVTPWYFSPEESELYSVATAISFCPQCDAEFEEGFAKFRRLPEEEKEAHFEAILRKQIELENAEQGVVRDPPPASSSAEPSDE